MSEETVQSKLQAIRQRIEQCQACELVRLATHAVPGEGSVHARIMIIGEAPGHYEDAQGRPFVGNSGKFLTELLGKAGLSREDVFITNVVKHRPPGNRDPLPDEIVACAHFLDEQIEVIDPDVIVTLGRFSMMRYFPGERITRIHGKAKEVGGRFIVPMYHPAAALHNGAIRPEIEHDFMQLPRLLAEREAARERRAAQDQPQLSQGTLF